MILAIEMLDFEYFFDKIDNFGCKIRRYMNLYFNFKMSNKFLYLLDLTSYFNF